MRKFNVRINGTINDEIEIEVDDQVTDFADAAKIALSEWRYVEYEDLWVHDIEPVEPT